MKKIISTQNAPAAIGPYSQAIEWGGMIFTSGMLPADPKTGLIPDAVTDQARQVFVNLKNLLEAAGTTMEKVIKTTMFIKDMNDFSAINEIYKEYFTDNFPARSCVEVARLPKDIKIEVELIAEK